MLEFVRANLARESLVLQTIMVGIKRVVDYNVRVRVKPDGSGMATDGTEDEHQPVRRDRDRGGAASSRSAAQFAHVLLATIGPRRRRAAAAHRFGDGGRSCDSCRRIRRARAADRGARAARAGAARASRASSCSASRPSTTITARRARCSRRSGAGRRPRSPRQLAIAGGVATVTREIDAGLETLEVELPAVVTTDLRLNQPRYVKLPEILKAKSKPLAVRAARELGVRRRTAVRGARFHTARAARAQASASRTSPSSSPRSRRAGCCRDARARRRRARRCAARSRDCEMRALRARSATGRARRCRARARRRRRRGAGRAARRRHRGRCSSTRRTMPRRSRRCSRRRSRAWPRGFTHVLGPSSTFGKDLLPRVAALLGVGQISDVLAVVGPHRFRRPILRGQRSRHGDGGPARARRRDGAARVVLGRRQRARRHPIDATRARRRGADPYAVRRAPRQRRNAAGSQTAGRVVSGGRALGSAQGFQLVAELADVLGAPLGASRAAVDSGFVANDLQVGQTGKIIAPGALRRRRHLGRHSARHGHQGCAHDRRDQQRPGGADLRDRRRRPRGRPVPGCSRAHQRAPGAAAHAQR